MPKTTTLKENDLIMVSDGVTSSTISSVDFKKEITKDVQVDTSNLASKTELNNGLNSKANISHTHSEYATTTQLNSKADVGHNHDNSYASKLSEHTHTNKSELDKIQTGDKAKWDSKATASDIPTKTSQLTNDSNFTTQSQVNTELDKKADKETTYTKTEVNVLIDGVSAGDVDLTNYYTKTQTNDELAKKSNVGHNHVIGDIENFPVLHDVATSGDYTDLINKPSIPTVTNDLTNALKTNYDAAYTHSQQSHAPANAEQNVQSDWNISDINSDAYIKNKPNIPDVSNFYTKGETDQKIADAVTGGTVDLGNYYTKQETYSKSETDSTMNTKVDKATGKSLVSDTDIAKIHAHPNSTELNLFATGDKGKLDSSYSHSTSSHAPATAQKNSDITKAEIEAKLTGIIITHTHTVDYATTSEIQALFV